MERRRRIRRWERGERLCGGRLNGGEQKNRFQNKYRRAEDFLREPGPGDFAPMVHGRLTGAGQKLQEQPANVKPDPPSRAPVHPEVVGDGARRSRRLNLLSSPQDKRQNDKSGSKGFRAIQ